MSKPQQPTQPTRPTTPPRDPAPVRHGGPFQPRYTGSYCCEIAEFDGPGACDCLPFAAEALAALRAPISWDLTGGAR